MILPFASSVRLQHPYLLGRHALQATKTAADSKPSYGMAGRLYLSRTGWLMLSVPNAFVRGAFDALQEPGVELPPSPGGVLEAHISVMRPEELQQIGGPGKVSERGHVFRYSPTRLRVIEPVGWPEMSRCWILEVRSPELEKLRKSYGLSAKPRDDQYEFHITIAVRKRRVFQQGSETVKLPTDFPDIAKIGSLAGDIAAAAKQTNTDPTPGQQEAGNYRKGRVTIQGLTVAIENPQGSTRSGVSPDGKAWQTKMRAHYGYFQQTEGRDADPIDVFVGPEPDSEVVFVINQLDPTTKKFDEHKVMLGWTNEAAARQAYLDHYEKGWQGLGEIRSMTVSQFKQWLAGDKTSRPAPDVKVAMPVFQQALIAEMSQPRIGGNFSLGGLRDFASQYVRRGEQILAERAAHDRYLNSLDPARGFQQAQTSLQGRLPYVEHPLDEVLFAGRLS